MYDLIFAIKLDVVKELEKMLQETDELQMDWNVELIFQVCVPLHLITSNKQIDGLDEAIKAILLSKSYQTLI